MRSFNNWLTPDGEETEESKEESVPKKINPLKNEVSSTENVSDASMTFFFLILNR